MHDLRQFSLKELEEVFSILALQKFRARQLYEWIHKKAIMSLEEAHNLGQKTIATLRENGYDLATITCLREQVSKDGTKKYLLSFSDYSSVECVLMHYDGDFAKKRYTLCVSTQVGCAMGCVFCATGKQGLTRQLSLGEILGQVYYMNYLLKKDDARVGNIVFMGMGEPFHNYDNVIKSLSFLNDERGSHIGMRRMTISTCGLVPEIKRFADLDLDVGLAISLHEVDDAARSELMPINKRYSLEALIDACHYYQKKTKRRISFEYALVNHKNVSQEKAKQLALLLKGLDSHLNLIPINPVNALFSRPTPNDIHQFMKALEKYGLKASVREEKGVDIDGACGQLKSNY